ncbi:MAG TPA: alpha/beta fold hydrolase [Spirochaetales bacterium]|nr:alpha/beta fold hydrolase [Spirochaetales bacterium]
MIGRIFCALCSAAGLALLAWLSGGPAALAWVAVGGLALLAAAVYNLGYWPRPRARAPVPPDPSRVRWPEALPLESFKGNNRLLFCLHGFPSTPADFRKVEAASNQRGWDLYAPLLPGHGTMPSDLYGTSWDQYLAYALERWRQLRPRYSQACLVGSSMGGSLCLALAEACRDEPGLTPSALATIGSPVVLNSLFRHALVKNPLIYASRSLGWILPALGSGYPDPDRQGVDGDGSWKGYLGVYPRQTWTLQAGLRTVERNLGRVTCPVLICHATGDRIVPYRNAEILARGLGSDTVELYAAKMDRFDHARHNLILYDSQRDRVWARILAFFEETLA